MHALDRTDITLPLHYPSAVTGSHIEDPRAVYRAFRWVQERRVDGQKILLWTRRKTDIRLNRPATLVSRHHDVVVGSRHSPYLSVWNEGPVLGFGLDEDDLVHVSAGNPTALCVVPRKPYSLTRRWILSVGPEILSEDRTE
ncbi:hypothetical protein ABH922_004910 [Rhodococcus sp. 27YEA15]|uniref:hypothetical protein n=1 Tax=Rhodococcus sp. 27YEA15 TaxID=3156259 RepID=UPI003C7AA2C2